MSSRRFIGHELRLRKSFAKYQSMVEIPNLIEVQKRSYDQFLQADVDPDRRADVGLHGVFRSVFPIWDYNRTAMIEYVNYQLEPPKYDEEECRQRGATYESPLKITFRLHVYESEDGQSTGRVRDVKEQTIYMGNIPIMTPRGSFIINGVERVVVSQLHRSPGVFFDQDVVKNTTVGKALFTARIIPYRGSWLDFEFDQKDIVYVRIDRKRKLPVTLLLKALGYTTDQLLNFFYEVDWVQIRDGRFFKKLNYENLAGQRAICDIVDPKTQLPIVKAGRRITRAVVKKLQQAGIDEIELSPDDMAAGGRILARPIFDEKTGEIIIDSNTELDKNVVQTILKLGLTEIYVIFMDGVTAGPYIRNTLLIDKVSGQEEALTKIFQHMRPGEPVTPDIAQTFFHKLFFDPETYDLSEVGRIKINHKFGFSFDEFPANLRVLTHKDILYTVKYLTELKIGKGQLDDIDHLGNRRVRPVGELLENQIRAGLVRMERAIRERMALADLETSMPYDLINPRPFASVVKEFFATSQLSQFMDQTNPLSEITHKRRLSALGPGGLNRERAGFEVRDVHFTHYGRICPIETPEGQNIGLISSLATFARINRHGFIETPYRVVKDGVPTQEVVYLSALEEQGKIIAPAPRDEAEFLNSDNQILCRKDGEYVLASRKQVDLMDVAPSQIVSIAASLIPFLEHDDANRALMGSNMQRQAVPSLKARAPLVGTGVERLVARDSGACVVALHDGVVEEVDASRIVIRRLGRGGETGAHVDIYNLIKYRRTNQNTCFNQKPLVRKGDLVKKGDIIADGPSTELGELALGQNVIVAFMPWMGYNFEDSVLISERLITDDVYTSIHIEEFECLARDTKLGKEEITRDIPNLSEESLKDLDASGIIRIGAQVRPGSILVGKVTPKGESQLSPEEKLLRAIFGDKAGDVRDTSLRADPGVYGTVIDVQVFSREGIDKDPRLKELIQEKRQKLLKDFELEKNVIRNNALEKLKKILVGQKTTGMLLSEDGSQKLLSKGQVITEQDLETIPFDLLMYIPLESELEFQVTRIVDAARNQIEAISHIYQEKINRLGKGDDLPAGVVKMVKVYVAVKRKLQVGDKFAGRHGNKGVVSKVLPVQDMPYLPDGTPVDMVLNPLGVPSRMNIGQILEVHLGWAARNLGLWVAQVLDNWNEVEARRRLKEVYSDPELQKKIDGADEASLRQMVEYVKDGIHVETPVFAGAREEEIKALLKKAGLDETGKTILFDGRTGEPFQNPVTVGVMYMLKLHHLVEEKIHARAIGPYSLVSQQPLGGKSQFGGQRLGEMEVWAIEAYGAAYTLQEFLTVKSDDVAGRTRMFESIVRGDYVLEPGLPEAFNVLVNELKALALNVELIENDVLSDSQSKDHSEETEASRPVNIN